MARRGRSSLLDETTFFVTTTVVNFAQVFTKDCYCDIFIRNIKHYQEHYKFAVHAYVIMPSHFHWILRIDPKHGTVSDVMRDIKKYSAWDLMEALAKDGRDELVRLFRRMARDSADQSRRFWMKRFDDEVIRSPAMMSQKEEYIHQNPVVAGLVDDPIEYKYSSARNYHLGDHSVLEVDTEWF